MKARNQKPSKSTTSTSHLEDHLGYWLRFVSNHVSQGFQVRVEAAGVTVAEWVLMRELLRAGSTQPARLSEAMGMTRGAISKLVNRLEKKGMLVRSDSNSDGRQQDIRLSATGRALVPKLARMADENDRAFFGHLSGVDKKQLMTLLQQIVRHHGWKDIPIR